MYLASSRPFPPSSYTSSLTLSSLSLNLTCSGELLRAERIASELLVSMRGGEITAIGRELSLTDGEEEKDGSGDDGGWGR